THTYNFTLTQTNVLLHKIHTLTTRIGSCTLSHTHTHTLTHAHTHTHTHTHTQTSLVWTCQTSCLTDRKQKNNPSNIQLWVSHTEFISHLMRTKVAKHTWKMKTVQQNGVYS